MEYFKEKYIPGIISNIKPAITINIKEMYNSRVLIKSLKPENIISKLKSSPLEIFKAKSEPPYINGPEANRLIKAK